MHEKANIITHIALAIGLAVISVPLAAESSELSGETSSTSTNRLSGAESPYLLLHADNPVDWYPWGEEAFARARAEDKPIFLSVGYSTCFWCHVAERTLFSNPAIAALMNRWFINVKVDREQRPDIDRAYMLSRQLLTGTGGWPNNVFLTPDLEAFYAGSYFPPARDERGRAGFPDVMRAINEAWTKRRPDVLATVEQVQRALARVNADSTAIKEPTALQPRRWVNAAIRSILMRFDPRQGGFTDAGGVTKFPQSPTLLLLLDEYRQSKDETVAAALTETLDAMAYGGIQDHLAGGFHRYSTDLEWSVPHFEKMLYDNAQLLRAYAEAHATFGKPLYLYTAKRIIHYLSTRMTAPGGALFTAEDAQVDGVEGASYVWTPGQIVAVLGDQDAKRFLRVYGLEPVPHSQAARRAADAPIDEDAGVLRVRLPLEEALSGSGYSDVVSLLESLDAARAKLLAERDRRTPPLRDEKLSVDLNGLAIDSFAVAGVALSESAYVAMATKAARYIWRKAFNERNGELYHQVFNDGPSGTGFLADYAHFARGLLSLHAATGEAIWHERAMRLTDALLARFATPRGHLRMTNAASELPVQPREHGDVAVPSGVSAAIDVLATLGSMPGGERYANAGARVLNAHAARVAQRPDAWPTTLSALFKRQAHALLSAANRRAPRPDQPPALQVTADQLTLSAVADAASSTVSITLSIRDGFHVNANPASLDYLIPTSVSFAGATPVSIGYPPAERFQPSFTDSALQVYDGSVTIVASFEPEDLSSAERIDATVTAQACNDTVCLPPSTMTVTVEQ